MCPTGWKTAVRHIKHAQHFRPLLATGHAKRQMLGSMVWRIAALPLPTG
ncbi:MAG: hypothetical protein WB763_19920 [Terriglobia bacterium]